MSTHLKILKMNDQKMTENVQKCVSRWTKTQKERNINFLGTAFKKLINSKIGPLNLCCLKELKVKGK